VAQVRRLALCAACALLLAGCGHSSAPKPPHGGPTLRLALPALPRTVDPAKAADLPSLNIAHEIYAGLTRFSGRGVVPDLADSWARSEGGLVWTFHLRKGLRWSDDRPIRAQDFRAAWLHALDPRTGSAYAQAEMGNIRGARPYHATGHGDVGVEAVDDRTLRVTLEHPVPWLDQQVAWPVFFPRPPAAGAYSGPFRLIYQPGRHPVLERNFNYWNAAAVKPSRLILTTATKGADAILPRNVAPPGFHWVQTAAAPTGWRALPTLARGLLWLVTRGTPLADPNARAFVYRSVLQLDPRPGPLVPRAMPGAATVNVGIPRLRDFSTAPPATLTLAYTRQDVEGAQLANRIRTRLGQEGVEVSLKAVPTLSQLVRLAGPPAQPGIDLVLLGWSSEYFDAYNLLDLFPCGSAFNVARWCDPSYDRLMRRAVRTLDDRSRWRLERRLAAMVEDAVPAVPLYSPKEHVLLNHGVVGFRWSPIGFYELMGMTRS
jgi:oligopeptide transport system substrate-binding protein